MFAKSALLAFSYAAVAVGQQAGTLTPEIHPALSWQKCTASGCVTQPGEITLDANWRRLYSTPGHTDCFTDNTWDSTLCPNGTSCAKNCALDGADYDDTHGITTSGDALTFKFSPEFLQEDTGSSRVYLLANDNQYQEFKVLNQEFTFDVDVSNLPNGLNGALYFTEMDADGGLSRYPTNKAGAKYGTGYCDSRCARDTKFISGVANSDGWTPSSIFSDAGTGNYGSCCNEMDIWVANKKFAAYGPHSCTTGTQSRCEGSACGGSASVCDPDGCDFNSFRMGDQTFYGPGMTVDTNKKFTVITQFITDDGTASGTLIEIRRIYVQDGVVIQNSKVNVPGMSPDYDSITSQYCDDRKAASASGHTSSFQDKGGMAGMSQGLSAGMVLILSVWDDHAVELLSGWLDSEYPSLDLRTLIDTEADASVTYSNIRVGDIGTTYTGASSPGSK